MLDRNDLDALDLEDVVDRDGGHWHRLDHNCWVGPNDQQLSEGQLIDLGVREVES
jgi:hypothetical protein